MADRTLTYAEAIQEALDQEMARDPAVYVLGEDVAIWGNLFGCTKGLLAKYGKERVRDTPISEAALMGCTVGSAAAGLRPVAEIMYIDFVSIALDQIINHAARWHQLSGGRVKVPMVVRTQGGVGFRNSSQHSQSLENWFVNIPGLVVVMPSTPYDAKGLLKAAVRDDNPVIVIEHKAMYRNKGVVPVDDYVIPLGKADVKRAGTDLTIVATSWMVVHALAAAEELAKQGISAEVVDPRTLYPLDEATICDSVRKTGHCLVVVEAPAAGGFSGEIASVVMESCFSELKKPVKRLCGQRTGIPYDKDLERAVVPSAADVAREARALLGR
jgi:acetoin:2,6-dichlorophenolindophenol oxidoreductase subunit beta